MFVDRKNELDALNREYDRNQAAFTVVYGRRRLGKTTLISEYIKDKHAVYFYATEAKPVRQIDLLTDQITRFLGNPGFDNIRFSDLEQLLTFFAGQLPDSRKTVFVIDEYQELVKTMPETSSVLQKVWDLHFKTKRIHLILCGSVLSMMYSETLSYDSPLYGRRTSNIHLKPMRIRHIDRFIPGVSMEDRLKIYAAFGGVPKYLEMYDTNLDFNANLIETILNKNSYLYEEGRFLLKDERSDGPTYFSILETIALGETKIGNIGGRLNMPSNHLSRYFQKLSELDIAEKEVPVTEKNPLTCKLGRYRIKDAFLRFWFRYVYRHGSLLEIGDTDYVMRDIENTFNQDFVAFAFEEYVKQTLLKHSEAILGYKPLKIGRWWSNKAEIDLVAFDDQRMTCIECKWLSKPAGYDVYANLVKKSEGIDLDLPGSYAIFSKEGFKASLDDAENVRLFTCGDLEGFNNIR